MIIARLIHLIAALLGGLALVVVHATAQTLTIGMQAETGSIDPHLYLANPSLGTARHIFDTLVHPDRQQTPTPGLALAWDPIGETEWEFRLRPETRFHDGSRLSAADVAFSLHRAATISGGDGGFPTLTRQITRIDVRTPLTVRLHTDAPFPLMPEHLSAVPILSRAVAEGRDANDFNTGKATIGTGPYRFRSWTKGQAVRLERNDAYWGPIPAWRNVTLRPITNEGARVAALLAGDVDMIDGVPFDSLATLHSRPELTLSQVASNRVVFLALNVNPASNPRITGAGGISLPQNPLADPRVRLAFSKAIDRERISGQLLLGLGVPASQLLPDFYPGTSTVLLPEPHDPAGARALMAEAGFPGGFALVLSAMSDRSANDPAIAGAVAQMLSRIGIRVELEARPFSIGSRMYQRGEFAVWLRGWGTETGEGSMALRALLGSRDLGRGWGAVNSGGYSNPSLDGLLAEALRTFDKTRREALIAHATEIGIRDVGLIPLHYQIMTWALRPGLTYPARPDGYSFAFDVRPAN